MRVQYLTRDRQPDAISAGLAIEPHERIEDAVAFVFGHAGAIVFHENMHVTTIYGQPDHNP